MKFRKDLNCVNDVELDDIEDIDMSEKAKSILNDSIDYLKMVGKARGIILLDSSKEEGFITVRGKNNKKVHVRLNRKKTMIDVFVYAKAFRRSGVEILSPFKRGITSNVEDLLSIVEEGFNCEDRIVH